AEHGLASIAFPAISTGVYRFPPERAARIAVGTMVAEVSTAPGTLKQVVLCCFSPDSARHHETAFADLGLVWALFEHDLFRKPVPTFRDHALTQKFSADFGGVLAERRHRTVIPCFARAARRRRGIVDHAALGADRDAPQMRMLRETGRIVHPCERDV